MAFRLGKLPRAPYELALVNDITVTVRPLTTPIWEAATSFALRAVTELIAGRDLMHEIGLDLASIPNLFNAEQREGFRRLLFAQALGRAAIVSWTGVEHELDGQWVAAAVNSDTINELMLSHAIAEDFVVKYTLRTASLLSEGNASGALPNGTSAEAPNTAPRADQPDSPAPPEGAA